MAIYNVDLRCSYRIERVCTMENIEADSEEQAAAIAQRRYLAANGELTPVHGFFQDRMDLASEQDNSCSCAPFIIVGERADDGFVKGKKFFAESGSPIASK